MGPTILTLITLKHEFQRILIGQLNFDLISVRILRNNKPVVSVTISGKVTVSLCVIKTGISRNVSHFLLEMRGNFVERMTQTGGFSSQVFWGIYLCASGVINDLQNSISGKIH